ncbi:transketolase [Novosphingobium sp. G106]|nr:transketolase [Novosphingobium sp. G106]
MAARRNAPEPADVTELSRRALNIRRHIVTEARGKGQGYVAQGLGVADLLAVLYFRELRLDPDNADWTARDRFVLSTGHYSIAMYAVLAEYGYIPVDELNTYGMAGSRLPMSTFDDVPGIEMVGGSLGHGLGQGVGMALAAKLDGRDLRVIVEISDGELQEGSTWEAAMSAATFNLDQLVVAIDCNGIQADGPVTTRIEPVADKWRAFGFDTVEVDGNDISKLCAAFDALREFNGLPKAIVMRTVPGKGIPTLEARERAHFVRTEAGEWDKLSAELERSW